MKKYFKYLVACATILSLGFTSCKSDDEKDPIDDDIRDLVTAPAPLTEGWSGQSQNGILKFAIDDYDAEELNPFCAFQMKGGICEKAVLNIEFPEAQYAEQFAQMLNNGTWTQMEDDEDDDYDDYYDYAASKNKKKSFDAASNILRRIYNVTQTRAENLILPIPVNCSGKVIYITITNLEGFSYADLQMIVDYWLGNSYETPNRVLFGKYENGIYSCNNIFGLNSTYVITTEYNAQGYCSKYTTRITLPTESWALLYYESLEEQLPDFEAKFGRQPDININGKTVAIDAIIIGDVPRSNIDALIYMLDWINNKPFLMSLFM